MRSITDASLIHDRISSAVNSGNKKGIVIVGSGATGVSLGRALSDFIKESKKIRLRLHNNSRSTTDHSLVMGCVFSNKVEEVLCEKGIRIMTSSPV